MLVLPFQTERRFGHQKYPAHHRICISIPLPKAEWEHIFSFLRRQLTKDYLSMNNKTLERILQFWLRTEDYSIEQYDHAIDLFFAEYPGRHNYPSERKKATNVQSKPSSLTEINEVFQQATTIDKINIVDISSSDRVATLF